MASNGVKKAYFLGFRGQKWPERVKLGNDTCNFGKIQDLAFQPVQIQPISKLGGVILGSFSRFWDLKVVKRAKSGVKNPKNGVKTALKWPERVKLGHDTPKNMLIFDEFQFILGQNSHFGLKFSCKSLKLHFYALKVLKMGYLGSKNPKTGSKLTQNGEKGSNWKMTPQKWPIFWWILDNFKKFSKKLHMNFWSTDLNWKVQKWSNHDEARKWSKLFFCKRDWLQS